MSVTYDTAYHNELSLKNLEQNVEEFMDFLEMNNDGAAANERITTTAFVTYLVLRTAMKIKAVRYQGTLGPRPWIKKEVAKRIFEECRKRHVMGAEKYGEKTFLTKEPEVLLQDFIEEVADIINYDLYLTYNATHNTTYDELLKEERADD